MNGTKNVLPLEAGDEQLNTILKPIIIIREK
jgi:hypothetical protein